LQQTGEEVPRQQEEARRVSSALEQARRVGSALASALASADNAERERALEEALRVAAERQRQDEVASRVVAEATERRRVAEQALRDAAEGAQWLPPPGLAAPPARGRAAEPWPKEIFDSRFEKERCARAIRCDDCEEWKRGNAVGTFWRTWDMPRAEFRRAAWESGEWDASWYCIECYAEYWRCSPQTVMERLGFTKRQSLKDEVLRARAASASTGPANPTQARNPASIADKRFEKERELRQIRCDHCKQLKGGNAAGAFFHRKNMPPAGERQAAWERGDWDATWYCTECYMLYYERSYEDVCNILGFARRHAKKARYAEGKP